MELTLYVITEIVEVDCVDAFVSTNNQTSDKSEAFNMFLTRRAMLLNSKSTLRVVKDNFSEKDEWGFTKVELETGVTIEIAFSKLELV